jgi:hypothetical protein
MFSLKPDDIVIIVAITILLIFVGMIPWAYVIERRLRVVQKSIVDHYHIIDPAINKFNEYEKQIEILRRELTLIKETYANLPRQH